MPTSLRKISEQASRLYARQSGRQVTKLMDQVEIRNLVVQVINRVLSAQYQAQDDSRGLPACIIATYKTVSVSSDDGFYCALPAQPILLPRDRGIHQVGPDDETSERFIPITSDDWDMFRAMGEATLEGFVGFYRESDKIRFTSDPSTPVRVKLLVADPAVLGLDDVLPVGADMEDVVIAEVVNIMARSGVSEV